MRELSKIACFFQKYFRFHGVILLISSVFASLCAISCDLPPGSAYNAEKGTIRLILPGRNGFSRSLSDDFIRDDISYKLTLTGPDKSEEPIILESPLEPVLTLKIGTWTIDVEAYDNAPTPVLVGNGREIIAVTAGQTSSVTIHMQIDPSYKAYYEGLPDIYIHNEAELRRVGSGLPGDFPIDGSKIFHLERNIVLTQPWTPIGDYTTPFEAVFDGGGHSITIGSFTGPNATTGDFFAYLGFFGLVNNAAIKNVTINYSDNPSNPTMMDFTGLVGSAYSGQQAGAVAGAAFNTSFQNIRVSGSFLVKGNATSNFSVGGIAGWNNYVTITNCHVEGDIAGETVAYLTMGGIAGNPIVVTISGSSFKGSIRTLSFDESIGAGGNNSTTGGIAGDLYDGEITACFFEGSIEAEAGNPNVGGIVGQAGGSTGSVIKNSYAAGTITSTSSGSLSHSGGIAGDLYTANGLIENCYVYANVRSGSANNGAVAGGIAGNNDGTISRCYAAGTVKSTGTGTITYINVGGIMGESSGAGSVNTSMALVSTLDLGSSSTPSRTANAICADVSPSVTLISNYSRDDIVFQNNTNTTPAPGSSNEAGQAIPLSNFKSAGHYIAIDWSFAPDPNPDWKFISGYDYPVLSWQTRPPVLP